MPVRGEGCEGGCCGRNGGGDLGWGRWRRPPVSGRWWRAKLGREGGAAAVPGPGSAKGPVGPRVPGAVPSHRRLSDARVSNLRGSSGTFGVSGTEQVNYEDMKMTNLCAS